MPQIYNIIRLDYFLAQTLWLSSLICFDKELIWSIGKSFDPGEDLLVSNALWFPIAIEEFRMGTGGMFMENVAPLEAYKPRIDK